MATAVATLLYIASKMTIVDTLLTINYLSYFGVIVFGMVVYLTSFYRPNISGHLCPLTTTVMANGNVDDDDDCSAKVVMFLRRLLGSLSAWFL